MSEEEKKKGLFDRMIDMVSTRDEKEQVEQAQKEVEESQAKVKAAQYAAAQASREDAAEKAALEKQLKEANERAAAADAKAEKLERDLRMQAAKSTPPSGDAAKWEGKYGRKAKAEESEFITTHELTSEETLSHLALKYYNHATPPYWQLIYEANKDVVGDNPNAVHAGMMIKIPVLPDELKDKE